MTDRVAGLESQSLRYGDIRHYELVTAKGEPHDPFRLCGMLGFYSAKAR
jgi:hypothetical protein